MTRLLKVLPAVLLGVLVALLIPLGLDVAAEDGDPVEAVLKAPHATGLLITVVVPESQAASVGLHVGDIVISYAGKPTPDIDALREAVGGAVAEASIEIEVVSPDGAAKVFSIAPGPIGIHPTPVVKDVPVGPLPPATAVAFDFSRLETDGAHDAWYAFRLADRAGHSGFEHANVHFAMDKLHGLLLVARREVAFDGGEPWGLNHFDVQITVTATTPPRLVRWTFLNPVTGYRVAGKVDLQGDPRRIHVTWNATGDEQGEEVHDLPTDLPVIPSYMPETLALFMSRTPGACFHYRVLQDGSGEIGRPTALLAAAEETLDVGGKPVRTVRYEVHQLGGGIVNTFWIDETGTSVKSDYGGATTTLTTEAKALEGLSEGIRPRTASRGARASD